MSLIGTLTTLGQLQEAFSDYVNEAGAPQPSDVLYQRRRRWFNRGREDLAGRFFFRALLASGTLELESGNAGPYELPDDLTRPNALRFLKSRTGGVEFTDPYERNQIQITRDMESGLYQVTLSAAPSSDDTADIDYFATPTPMVDDDDLVLVDGEAVLFFGLMQHFLARGAAAFNELDRVSQEYENRIQELLRSDAINVPGHQTGMRNFERARHTSEKGFYAGNTRRV